MEFEVMKRMLDENINSLIGQRIFNIQYAAIDYLDGKSHWDYGKIHEVEHGVEFTTESGETYQISWHSYGNDYGIYLSNKKHLIFWIEDAIVMWNVTEREEWKQILNQEIKEIKIFWHEFNHEISLQDVEFGFSNNHKIWFSASRYDLEKDQLSGGSDDISIIFEEPIARKHKRANYTDEKGVKFETYRK